MIHISSQNSNSVLSKYTAEQVQPNAVDLRLGKVFQILDNDFTIDEDMKVHRGSEEWPIWEDGYYHLTPGTYEVIMENEIEVGQGEAGWVITRYDGVMAGVMHVNCGKMKIKPGTRIGQYLNFKAENLSSYEGDYGKHGEHDKRYTAS